MSRPAALRISPFLRLADLARAAPDRLYARFGAQQITLGDAAAMSEAIARRLVAAGLGPGDRVAVMMANRPLLIALIFAIARAGMVWVPVNTRLQGEALGHILDHSAPALLVADRDLLPAVEGAGAWALPRILALAPDSEAMDLPPADPGLPLPPPPEDTATFAIMYTSGTTGQPKGVQVTHRMFGYAARAVERVCGIRDGDVLFVWEPLYHIGGSQLLLLPLYHDLHLHLVPRFSASRFWAEVAESGATHIHFLGGILQILLQAPPSALDRGHKVRIAWGGGCTRDEWEAFETRFGVDIREAYGMTEASSITTCNIDGPVGSVGRPVPWLRVELLDEQGHPVPPGARGEIVVTEAEPGVLFAGYLADQAATARALRGGRLHTGDSGSMDAQGNLYFHGRLNDSVRRRGENISAWEIEHVAQQHPAVAEVAMVGVKARIGEQEIKLFVRPAEGEALRAPELHGWLRERLGEFRTPRYIAFVDSFPKTPSERIRKALLSRETADSWDAEAPADPPPPVEWIAAATQPEGPG